MSVLTSLTRFSLRWSSSRRALSVLALLLAAPGYSCKADQTSPARVDKHASVSSSVMEAFRSGDFDKSWSVLKDAMTREDATLVEMTMCVALICLNLLLDMWQDCGLWIVKVMCYSLMQIVLLWCAIDVAGRWMDADTHAHMMAIRARMDGPLPYRSCFWHTVVSMVASSTSIVLRFFFIVVSVCIRTLWLYTQALREQCMRPEVDRR